LIFASPRRSRFCSCFTVLLLRPISVAAGIGDGIGFAPRGDHRVGRVDAGGQSRRKEQQGAFGGITVVGNLGDLNHTEVDYLTAARPHNR
jgi:hypothetical protein